MIEHVPDLVRDSKFDTTRIWPKYTAHQYYDSDDDRHERVVKRTEYWKRIRTVGGGYLSTVWLEECVRGRGPSAMRAVKQIPRRDVRSKRIDYHRELETIARFSQKKYRRFFVRSFGWYDNDDDVFIAMEYMSHGDLHAYVQSVSCLSELDAKQVVFQVLEGVSHLHLNGFAHRDLKPANILIKARPPEQWWVKIGDFGISKRVEDDVATQSSLKGTLDFMAPELLGFTTPETASQPAVNSPRRDQAADMWALGGTAFYLLTGQVCFKMPGLLGEYARDRTIFPTALLREKAVSHEALDFFSSVMAPSPIDRLFVRQALDHPWINAPQPGSRRASGSSFSSLEMSDDTSELLDPEIFGPSSAEWTDEAVPTSLGTPSDPPMIPDPVTAPDTSNTGEKVLGSCQTRSDSAFRTQPKDTEKRLPPIVSRPCAQIVSDQEALYRATRPEPDANSVNRVTLLPDYWQDESVDERILSHLFGENLFACGSVSPQLSLGEGLALPIQRSSMARNSQNDTAYRDNMYRSNGVDSLGVDRDGAVYVSLISILDDNESCLWVQDLNDQHGITVRHQPSRQGITMPSPPLPPQREHLLPIVNPEIRPFSSTLLSGANEYASQYLEICRDLTRSLIREEREDYDVPLTRDRRRRGAFNEEMALAERQDSLKRQALTLVEKRIVEALRPNPGGEVGEHIEIERQQRLAGLISIRSQLRKESNGQDPWRPKDKTELKNMGEEKAISGEKVDD